LGATSRASSILLQAAAATATYIQRPSFSLFGLPISISLGEADKTVRRRGRVTQMPGPAVAMEPVEPQSLKKLSFKSLKRALDLFAPLHGQFPPPDPERSVLSSPLSVSSPHNANPNADLILCPSIAAARRFG